MFTVEKEAKHRGGGGSEEDIKEDEFIRAKITKVVRNPHGNIIYVVTNKDITFSPESWRGSIGPLEKQIVFLKRDKIIMFQGGLRAMEVHPTPTCCLSN